MSLLLAPDSVDSIVCDPPYGLSKEPDAAEVLRHWLNGDDYAHTGNGFMGKSWDSFVPGPSVWREAYRVLKPGGYLLAFFGTRTYDLGVMAIRLAGFEIRDEIAWLYGSGFPKSLDVGKAIDRAAGAEREVVGVRTDFAARANKVRGDGQWREGSGFQNPGEIGQITAPATDAAKQWDGWGTALKPAHEPIVVARKPFPGTVAQNVQTYGTGALNIDACRVDAPDGVPSFSKRKDETCNAFGDGLNGSNRTGGSTSSRFPANVIHDGHVPFPTAPGQLAAASTSDTLRNGQNTYGAMRRPSLGASPRDDSGSAGRFFKCCQLDDEDIESARIFYAAKASKRDRSEGCEAIPPATAGQLSETSGQHMTRRDEGYVVEPRSNNHPTVKPTDLMRYLVRLVTPPGGTVLDPFTGSGSTGKAAILEGFVFIGCELDADYVRIAEARCAHASLTDSAPPALST